jgi:hypothetical protein
MLRGEIARRRRHKFERSEKVGIDGNFGIVGVCVVEQMRAWGARRDSRFAGIFVHPNRIHD